MKMIASLFTQKIPSRILGVRTSLDRCKFPTRHLLKKTPTPGGQHGNHEKTWKNLRLQSNIIPVRSQLETSENYCPFSLGRDFIEISLHLVWGTMMYHVRLLGGDLENAHYEPDFRPQKDPVMISVPTLRLSEDKIWRSDFTDLNFAPIFLFGAIIQLGMSLFSTRVAQAP